MALQRSGLYVALVNRSTSRIVFSACTSDLSEAEFSELWNTVGRLIYRGLVGPQQPGFPSSTAAGTYELRVEQLQGDPS